MSPDYIEIPTWPEYNNQNRVYLGSGICPTLTTQCSHSKPPLVLIGGPRMILKAPKAPRGKIIVEPGDGIAGYFLRNGQHPYCKGLSPTIPNCRVPWVVVEVRE